MASVSGSGSTSSVSIGSSPDSFSLSPLCRGLYSGGVSASRSSSVSTTVEEWAGMGDWLNLGPFATSMYFGLGVKEMPAMFEVDPTAPSWQCEVIGLFVMGRRRVLGLSPVGFGGVWLPMNGRVFDNRSLFAAAFILVRCAMRLWSRRRAVLRVFDPIGRPFPRTGGFCVSGADCSRPRGRPSPPPAARDGFVVSSSPEFFSSPFNIMILMCGRFLLMSSSEGSSIGFRDRASTLQFNFPGLYFNVYSYPVNLNIHCIRRCPGSFRLCIQFSGS